MTPKRCERIAVKPGSAGFGVDVVWFQCGLFGMTLAFCGRVAPADWFEASSGGSEWIDRSRDSQHVRKL
jgi:hypothetical protein